MDLTARMRGAVGDAAVEDGGVGWEIHGARPALAVRPQTEEHAAAALRVACEARAATVVWGGGTRMEAAAAPARYDCALSLARLDAILDHAPDDLTATVQAGATLSAVQSALRRHGQRLPVDGPFAARSTLGGLHASGTVGPRSHDLGSLRTLVVGCEGLTAAGTPFRAGGRVVKNVTGYDVHRLLFRSWGALAVLVRMHVRLAALPESERVVTARFRSAPAACAAAERVRLGSLRPVGLAVVSAAGPWSGDTGGVRVVAGWEGAAADVDEACERAAPAWEGADTVEETQGDDAGALWSELAACQAGSQAGQAGPAGGSGVRMRVAVPPSRLGEAWEAIAGDRVRARMAYADRGMLVIHAECPAEDRELDTWLAGAHRLAAALGGSLHVEACAPFPLSATRAWGGPSPHQALLERVKLSLDPDRLLAPGRLPGGL